ncbi:MAG TPA: hypothetical protein VN851_24575 [Thermoanaerobaculia bacterium]|nr:hypothetical protein [Thermoanaerobaculia bacterium]
MGVSVKQQLEALANLHTAFQIEVTLEDTTEGQKKALFEGYLTLRTIGGGSCFEVVDFGLLAPNISDLDTGILSTRWVGGEVTAQPEGADRVISLNGTIEVYYDSIGRESGFIYSPAANDVRLPKWRPLVGVLNLTLRERDATRFNEFIVVSGNGRFEAFGSFIPGAIIKVISFNLAGQTVMLVPPNRRQIRRVRLRPVFFRDSENDVSPSGGNWTEQLEGVLRLWAIPELVIHPEPPRIVTQQGVKADEDDVEVISGLFTDPSYQIIEIFMVDGDLGFGGFTIAAGAASAKIVLGKESVTNPQLLAHEFGHAVGGGHPRPPDDEPLWEATEGSVLEISEKFGGTNPDMNSDANRQRAANPVILPIRIWLP